MTEKKKRKPHLIKMKLIEIFIGMPLRFLSIKNIIIFESHSDFTDSSKVLFDEMIDNRINENYKIYWLVEKKDQFKEINIKNVKFISIERRNTFQKIVSEIKNAILFSQCKYYFYTHRNFSRNKPKKNQVFFYLTHGSSFKDTRGNISDIDKVTYATTQSKFTKELNVRVYNKGKEKIEILGLPRNDLLINEKKILSKIHSEKNNYDKVIIWMPTFRRHKGGSRNDSGTNSKNDIPIITNNENLLKLNGLLKDKNILLIIKPHPAQDMKFIKDFNSSNIKTLTNENLINKEIELYELLGQSDALITDYSSVYMDYLIINRPIGFIIEDISEYGDNLGFLVENPLDYMPGMKIKNINDMLEFIENISLGKDNYKEERICIGNILNKYKDNKSSFRILKFLRLI